ncbi:hypothetical protein CC80DRAFT_112948 [Byssothecium circinans]|uniref:Uncharacterized protein n=1 Tax=Byssothecium circinans TaxID=147558 RepID=A0A6A5U1R6_9PLEO|nr:hypothetical protein CC80DRAFT_112948 [Byssothecium circinans]
MYHGGIIKCFCLFKSSSTTANSKTSLQDAQNAKRKCLHPPHWCDATPPPALHRSAPKEEKHATGKEMQNMQPPFHLKKAPLRRFPRSLIAHLPSPFSTHTPQASSAPTGSLKPHALPKNHVARHGLSSKTIVRLRMVGVICVSGSKVLHALRR